MKFLHTLKQDLNKTVINLGFIGAVFITFIFGFMGIAYMDNANGGKEYSVLEALTAFDREFITSHSDFSALRIFTMGLSNYSVMFMPIIVALPFTVSFCAERNNGLMRFTISRTGKLRYYISKFFASALSGGLAVLIGMILFGVFAEAMFPPLSSYGDNCIYVYTYGETQTVLRTLLGTFYFGAFSALPAFFISSFCKNPYIITCLPFMLVYIWNTVIQKIQFRIWEDPDNVDPTLWEKLAACLPKSCQELAFIGVGELTQFQKYALIFNLGYLAFMLVGFILIMNLRTDKGS